MPFTFNFFILDFVHLEECQKRALKKFDNRKKEPKRRIFPEKELGPA
jgi:hypothetical protein